MTEYLVAGPAVEYDRGVWFPLIENPASESTDVLERAKWEARDPDAAISLAAPGKTGRFLYSSAYYTRFKER